MLVDPVNFTDPYIFHDPVYKAGKVAQLYEPEDALYGRDDSAKELDYTAINADAKEVTSGANNYDTEKVAGIMYPIVQVNNKVITHEQIKKMVIKYDSFLPTIELQIEDVNNDIQATDIPGLNNIIRVIIVPAIDNTYKSISLEFKIQHFKVNEEIVNYYGTYRLITLTTEHTKEIVYPGCPNHSANRIGGNAEKMKGEVSCIPGPNKKPSTWEYLHVIAQECGLGFMATDECKEIRDCMPRLMSNQSYPDFIEKHIKFGGLDEDSIFDCWIDLYGYLVLVNLSWILKNEDVTEDNLGIYSALGIQSTENNVPKQQIKLVNRTITNFAYMQNPSNMTFSFYRTIVDNSDLIFGTNISQYTFNLVGVNEENSNAVTQHDVKVVQDSIDGKRTGEYNVEKLKNLVIEFNELQINKQQIIREKYLSKHRQRKLEILLTRPNLGFQRGTLISVVIFENNPIVKTEIGDQLPNLEEKVDNDEGHTLYYGGENDEMEIKMNESMQVPNMALTGLYYIDGMRFEYDRDLDDMKQFLILIKKGPVTNIDNFNTPFRHKDHKAINTSVQSK